MKYTIRILLFCIAALALLPGASCPSKDNPPVPRESPENNLRVMRQALQKDDYSTAYYSLSSNTRQRYSYMNFKLMMEYTVFGILVKNMLVNWDVKSVKYFSDKEAATPKTGDNPSARLPDGAETCDPADAKACVDKANPSAAPVGKPKKTEKSRVLLQHWKYPEYTKEFIFIYEDDGWRIDLTMANLLGMPQEEEDQLFPVRKGNE